MEKKMLINALHPEESRIAITEDGVLSELEIESTSTRKLKGNIYKARISRIEPSLQAAFLDIGSNRNGFLQINDIHPAYFRHNGRNAGGHRQQRVRIQDVLEAGQELIVQVVKEEREQKGATLTTFLSLPGRYVVALPGSDRGGVSRKISNADSRTRLRNLCQELEVPAGIGLIIRTAGLDRSLAELSRDLTLLLKVWERIVGQALTAPSPSVLFYESDLATRVIRDYFTPEIREICIDHKETFNQVRRFVDEVMPRYRSRVKLYEDSQPLFSHAGIEDQVHNTFRREVKLPSGGAIVIDQLEALVAIDVNSGKATAGGNIEETAFHTNLEAADEIARQLRLRDLGGLIVIDFIDMLDVRHREKLERRVKEAVETDKARVELGRVSKFGLLEMSRQRLRASLSSQVHHKCSHCEGLGSLRNPEHVALEALRKVQSALAVSKVGVVKMRLAPQPALFLLNHKKKDLVALEQAHTAEIFVLADGRLQSDKYELEFESGGTRQVVSAEAAKTQREEDSPVSGRDASAEDELDQLREQVAEDEALIEEGADSNQEGGSVTEPTPEAQGS